MSTYYYLFAETAMLLAWSTATPQLLQPGKAAVPFVAAASPVAASCNAELPSSRASLRLSWLWLRQLPACVERLHAGL